MAAPAPTQSKCYSECLLHTGNFIGTLSVESINTVSNFSIGNGLLALLLSLMLLFWHELGHAAAATRCGLRSDGIGLGIYFLFPAMFTRISTLSLASSDEKIYFLVPVFTSMHSTNRFIAPIPSDIYAMVNASGGN